MRNKHQKAPKRFKYMLHCIDWMRALRCIRKLLEWKKKPNGWWQSRLHGDKDDINWNQTTGRTIRIEKKNELPKKCIHVQNSAPNRSRVNFSIYLLCYQCFVFSVFSITCATDNNLWIQLSSVTDTYVYDGLYIVYIHTYAHIWSILIVSMHFTWTMHHYTANN